MNSVIELVGRGHFCLLIVV